MKLTHQSPSLQEQQSQTYIHRSWRLTIGAGAAIRAAEPKHCNERVSFTALARRAQIIPPRRRGRKGFFRGFLGAPPHHPNPPTPPPFPRIPLSFPPPPHIL